MNTKEVPVSSFKFPKVCTCYVGSLSDEARFSIHYGAHALDCPVYRPSLDPVDAMHDQDLRSRYTDI